VFNCSFENLRGIPINVIEVGGRYGVSYYSEGIKAHHNYIKNCHGDGIYFRFCMYSDVTDNVILDTGFTDGIIFEAVKYGNVSNNHIYHPTAASGPARGILINGGSDDCIVSGNTVKVNTLNNAIFLVDSFRAQVTGNNLSRDGDASGFALITSHTSQGLRDTYNNIHDNTLLNGSPGIRISNNHNRISGNVISGGTEGIIVDGGNNNIISNNDIVADGYGIKLRGYDGRPHPIGTVVLNNRTNRIDDAGIKSIKRGNIFSTGPISGKATLVAGMVKVDTSEVTPSDDISLTRSIAGGSFGHLSVGPIVAGTSFVINSSSSTDTSTIFWEIRH
jgi:parallel beta-helix repeat protein